MAKKQQRPSLAADWSKVFPPLPPPPPRTVEVPTKKRIKAAKPTRSKTTETDVMPKLKGISLRQPWAEEIMLGKKKEEYRHIPTKHRGRIYIYAGLGRFTKDEEEDYAAEVGYAIDDLPRGVVIGSVEIVDCIEDGLGYAWLIANPQRLPTPVAPIEQPQPIWFHPFGKP
jgi:hypothetical protein